ncbi:MAG: diacylglycerol kinase family lipid kinase [Flavobacteriales bacterium]|nr:diacylglycerol kinase family lipid kinase [Flavobacteriales bacterium]
MKRIVFIVKGISKNYSRFESFYERLQAPAYEFSIKSTQYAGHAAELAVEAVDEGFDCVVAVGGDGTLNEVVNGLFVASKTDIVLAHLPLGTANDFAKSQGLKLDPDHFLDLLKHKKHRPIDIGHLTAIDDNGKPVSKYFINILSVGLGGHIVETVDKDERTLPSKKMKFFKAITQGMYKFKKPIVAIEAEEFSYKGPLMMLAVCNAGNFGSGLTINPDAKIDDGIFHLTLAGDVSVQDYIANYFKLKKGKRMSHPNISYHAANTVSITCKQEIPCPMEIDGEFVGYPPANVTMIKSGIRLLF